MNGTHVQRKLTYFAALLLALTSAVVADELERNFVAPPDTVKLSSYWWWLNGNVTKEAITRDLEALKEKGFGGALITDAGGANQDGNRQVPHGPDFASPQWRELYRHALREAARLKLEMALNIQSGWNLGGPGERKQFGCAEDVLPTLLDLAAVSDTVPKHLPFTGVSLRPALNDAGKTFERPAALRMDIAGVGAPKNGPGGRKLENVHLALRGPRFKYHALPGGKASLFDLDADPGETTDAQGKFPKVAAKMAADCRQRWDEILASGRAFAPQPSPAPAARKNPPSSSGD